LSQEEKRGKIDVAEVEYVAKLARLSINPEDKPVMAKQLAGILDYIDKLNQLDTKKIPPTTHILQINNVYREDEVRESLPKEIALENAPDKEGPFFRVPKVIEDTK
jgi:aspartyl-tRNA(Asn)/glutamyl-tRNA(Gln) amidotransferase subunit C